MRKRKPCVLGLDLSLRASAAVVLKPVWKPGDWNVPTWVVGYGLEAATPAQVAKRLYDITQELIRFARQHKPTHVYVEQYAYGLAARGGMALGELGGSVKAEFYGELGLAVVPVNASSVRKYFLGKLPRKGQAVEAHRVLVEAGCPFKTSDERDAFLCASYGRTELGLPGLTIATTG